MKKGLFFLLSLMLVATFAGTASAATAAQLDPCAAATVTVDVVNISETTLLDTADNFTSIASYELESGGSTVGHVVSKFTSQSFGALTYVASEETAIIDALALTVFGQSSNTVGGIAGAAGVITGAATFDGQKINDITGTYIFSDFAGTLQICFFITP